jgi:hypothetical protein
LVHKDGCTQIANEIGTASNSMTVGSARNGASTSLAAVGRAVRWSQPHGERRGASVGLAGAVFFGCWEQQLVQEYVSCDFALAVATGSSQQHQPIGIRMSRLHTGARIRRDKRIML